MLHTSLCDVLGIELPIIQGGLAYLATAELCAAVSNAGGLGQITATTLIEPEVLRAEIGRCKELTDKPFGINFPFGHRPLEPMVDVALEEGVSIVSFSGMNPASHIKYIDQRVKGVKKIVLTAGVRAAQKAESLGADAIVTIGFDAGGHLGKDDLGTMALIPRVVNAVRIPVVAAGGITDGRGLIAALALGADGIQMGTRFVAVRECPAHENYKQALVDGDLDGTVVMERSIGRPARVLASGGAKRVLEAEAKGVTFEQLFPLISGEANVRAAIEGDLDKGFVYAGQGMGLINGIPTVAELMVNIVNEAKVVAARLGAFAAL